MVVGADKQATKSIVKNAISAALFVILTCFYSLYRLAKGRYDKRVDRVNANYPGILKSLLDEAANAEKSPAA